MGVSWQEFWSMNPRIIKLLIKGHEEKIREQDHLAWISNQYTLSAVFVAVDRIFNGSKAKSEYIKEPIMQKYFENQGLTEEEIQQKEIKKAIMIEEQYMAKARKANLPETLIL